MELQIFGKRKLILDQLEMTSESRRCCNVNARSENRRRKRNVVTMLVLSRSNDVENTML